MGGGGCYITHHGYVTECISCEVINDDVRRSAVNNTAASKTTVVQSHDSNDQESRVWGEGGGGRGEEGINRLYQSCSEHKITWKCTHHIIENKGS